MHRSSVVAPIANRLYLGLRLGYRGLSSCWLVLLLRLLVVLLLLLVRLLVRLLRLLVLLLRLLVLVRLLLVLLLLLLHLSGWWWLHRVPLVTFPQRITHWTYDDLWIQAARCRGKIDSHLDLQNCDSSALQTALTVLPLLWLHTFKALR